MRFIFLLFFLSVISSQLFSQDSSGFFFSSQEFNKKKFVLSQGTQVIGYGGSLVFLSRSWYKNYPHSSFHFFDDSNEWLQMDKVGHFTTSYYLSRMGIDMMGWSGVKNNKSNLYGAAASFLFLTGIEVLDGFSQGWGFSWSDFSANAIGTGLIIGQKYLQRMQVRNLLLKGISSMSIKFSFSKSVYAQFRPSLLGDNLAENILKDYNGQTYWASVNISSFLGEEIKFPKWFNLAFGYGAEGMISGDPGYVYTYQNGSTIEFERYRQYYLSLDIDLTRIKTKSCFLKTLAETFSFIKIPAPAFEFNRNGTHLHGFYW